MPADDPRSLKELLHSGDIGLLLRESKQRRQLTDKVRNLLPVEEGQHLVSARSEPDGQLVLVMDSAAWAARVRYRTREFDGRQLRVRVVPDVQAKTGG